jgi:hypothetical protein
VLADFIEELIHGTLQSRGDIACGDHRRADPGTGKLRPEAGAHGIEFLSRFSADE